MAVTLADALLEVCGKTGREMENDPIRPTLARMLDQAVAQVERYAPDAPETVRDAAILRAIYFDYWTRFPAGRTQLRPARGVPRDPLVASGAAAILSRWKRRRAGAC